MQSQPHIPAGAEIIGSGIGDGPGPQVMAASSLDGTTAYSSDGQDVGKISEIMLDVPHGRIAYAVLTTGGFLGIGNRLHAIPWSALVMDTDEKCFRIAMTAERIKTAPGFDKDNWPSMADPQWGVSVHEYYGREPYWGNRQETR